MAKVLTLDGIRRTRPRKCRSVKDGQGATHKYCIRKTRQGSSLPMVYTIDYTSAFRGRKHKEPAIRYYKTKRGAEKYVSKRLAAIRKRR
jgi:hypothetical protein